MGKINIIFLATAATRVIVADTRIQVLKFEPL